MCWKYSKGMYAAPILALLKNYSKYLRAFNKTEKKEREVLYFMFRMFSNFCRWNYCNCNCTQLHIYSLDIFQSNRCCCNFANKNFITQRNKTNFSWKRKLSVFIFSSSFLMEEILDRPLRKSNQIEYWRRVFYARNEIKLYGNRMHFIWRNAIKYENGIENVFHRMPPGGFTNHHNVRKTAIPF